MVGETWCGAGTGAGLDVDGQQARLSRCAADGFQHGADFLTDLFHPNFWSVGNLQPFLVLCTGCGKLLSDAPEDVVRDGVVAGRHRRLDEEIGPVAGREPEELTLRV